MSRRTGQSRHKKRWSRDQITYIHCSPTIWSEIFVKFRWNFIGFPVVLEEIKKEENNSDEAIMKKYSKEEVRFFPFLHLQRTSIIPMRPSNIYAHTRVGTAAMQKWYRNKDWCCAPRTKDVGTKKMYDVILRYHRWCDWRLCWREWKNLQTEKSRKFPKWFWEKSWNFWMEERETVSCRHFIRADMTAFQEMHCVVAALPHAWK